MMRFSIGEVQCWGEEPGDRESCIECLKPEQEVQEDVGQNMDAQFGLAFLLPAEEVVGAIPPTLQIDLRGADRKKRFVTQIPILSTESAEAPDPALSPPMLCFREPSGFVECSPQAATSKDVPASQVDSSHGASFDAILAEARTVSNKVVDALRAPSFRAPQPEENQLYDNAMWLRERVAALDALDPRAPMRIVHWSVLKKLQCMPRNPDDGFYLRRAIDVIDEYITGSSTRLLVICMVSHRWRRPTCPHPDDDRHHKASALARYGEAALARNVELHYWIDYAGVNQENLRDRIVGISKLPCIIASCSEFLVFWSSDYEQRAWTRMERFIGYALSPCSQFRVIDEHYGRPVPSEALTKSGAVVQTSIFPTTFILKITDPLSGKLTSEENRHQLTRLVEVGNMFLSPAYRAENKKSTINLIRMAGAPAGLRRSVVAREEIGSEFTVVDLREGEKCSDSQKAAEDVFTKQAKEFIEGTGFTLKWFVLYNLLRSFLPVFFNSLWIAGAGIGHCGSQQSFLTYVFEYELYFMAVKGIMMSAYYWLFMPPPVPGRVECTLVLHAVFGCMLVIFAAGMSALWQMLAFSHDGFASWLLFKLNFPGAAILSFVMFAPLYLRFNFQAGQRYFAAKRYFVLAVVLVCGLVLMSASHAYLFFFTWAIEEVVPRYEGNLVLTIPLQALLVAGYTMVIMPIFGKIFWMGVYLVDTLAPMPGLQHQRFVYFATVVCDMHRLMYSRELLAGLDSLFLFYLILLKDVSYMIYHFLVKAHPVWQTIVIGVLHPDGMTDTGQYSMMVLRVFKCLGELMECPKMWLSWHRETIDAGYKGTTEAPSSSITFFCCDTLIQVLNLPSVFSAKFAKLKDMPERERRAMIKEWLDENSYHVTNFAAKVDARTKEQAVERATDLAMEVKLAEAAADYEDEIHRDVLMPSRACSSSSWTLGLTWEHEFYRCLNLRLNGVIFLRAQARITIGIAVSLSYMVTGFIIRATPSREVLNFVQDHTKEVESRSVLAGVSFLVSDLLVMALLDWFHMRKQQHRLFHLAKFGSIFQSKVMYAMICVCTVSCSSDLFLTYPDIDFCHNP